MNFLKIFSYWNASKLWNFGGEGGVAMHFDAWGAMCEIKELLVIPMIKYLKFHPHAASFSLASLQKNRCRKWIGSIPAVPKLKQKESIILCLCFFPTWIDWFHWLDTSDDWQDGRSLNNQTEGLDKSLQRIFYFQFFPPWCKEIWPCFACVKANILKECAQDIFFAFRTLKRGGKPFWLTVKNICYMVWLSNFPNTRFPLSILKLYSMCLF